MLSIYFVTRNDIPPFLTQKKKKKVSAKRLFINIIRHSLFLDLLSYDDLFPSINHLGKNILRFKETETEKKNIFFSKKKKKKSISFFFKFEILRS